MYFSRITLRSEILRSSQLQRVLEGNAYGAHRLLWDLFTEQRRHFIYREEIAREQLSSSFNVRRGPIYYMVSRFGPVEPEHSLFKVETKSYQPQLSVKQVLKFDCRVNPVITRNSKKHDVVMDAQLVFLKDLIKQLNLESELPEKSSKLDYKKLLLTKTSKILKPQLIEILATNNQYAEQIKQVTTLSEILELGIKAQVDITLENWWKKQGDRCGFNLVIDGSGLSKLQNSAYQWHALPEKGKKAGFSSVDFTGELQITDIDKFKTVLFDGLGRSKAFGCGLLMIKKP
jgi:CRISPR system Cascade subunit CasE